MEMKKHRTVEFQYEECVVGQSVNCLAYAYMNKLPVFGLSKYKPLEFDFIDPDIDLSPLMIKNDLNIIKTFQGEELKVGMDKIKLWHILCSHLSYAGLLPCFGMYDHISVVSNTHLKIPVENKTIHVNSRSIIFFDVMDNLLYDVNDYIDINKDSNISFDYYAPSTPSISWPFYKEMYFYNSKRVYGNHTNKKDVCAKSILNKEQISSFDYSEFDMKIKIAVFLTNEVGKKCQLSLNRREFRPFFDSVFKMEEIMNLDVEMDELKKLLYKHYVCSPCDIR